MTDDQRAHMLAVKRENNRRRRAKPEVRAAEREYQLARMADPAYRADKRRRSMDARALPEGHPGTCDVCGVIPEPNANGSRGIHQDHRHDNNIVRGYICGRCNRYLATIDLRYTDPSLFAKLMVYSTRGEPALTTTTDSAGRRKRPLSSPKLFE